MEIPLAQNGGEVMDKATRATIGKWMHRIRHLPIILQYVRFSQQCARDYLRAEIAERLREEKETS